MVNATPLISIVIPALNEEKNIGNVIADVRSSLVGRRYEIIVVDGNSSDSTVGIAERCRAIVMHDNVGKGSALIKGLRSAHGDILISMDADLSHEAKELNLLIDGINIGYDVCMGSRFMSGGNSEDISLLRKAGNKFFVLLVNTIFGANYSDMCYGYRAFSRRILKKLELSETGFGIETEISIKAVKKNLKVLEVPSIEKRRAAGEPKLRTFRDGWVILRTIIKNLC
ncbi:MAG: glycosyltransferase family 2 protein [Candidatus Marsarchaeota archaeon]|nr:glycosyltransferase family 2 protein [Candidatus Marsarchaeota archaeon]MCL5413196.1 glycosyltransferase family 2 protein [Candidatus Marsarchaeota archaeon]